MKYTIYPKFSFLIKSLFIVILISFFSMCNVIKDNILFPQLMVLRKALASVGLADNPSNPTQACSETANITITAPRFISVNQSASLKAVVDKSGYSFAWTQIAGDAMTVSNANTDTASFIGTEVPQESPKFQVTAKKDLCSFTAEVIVTPLESTANSVYVDASYTGGGSDGSLDKPYTDVASAYSLAPGAIYMAEGDYPVSALLNMVDAHSIYGGFNSKFERKVSTYITTINDTRNGVSSIYTLDTNTADTGTRLDGLTILGPANGDWANVVACGSGSPRLSHLNIQSRGVSPAGDSYTVWIGPSCSAIFEYNKVYANVSASSYCFGIFNFSSVVLIRQNEIYGNTNCGTGSVAIRIESTTNFNFNEYNYIDAVGTSGGGNSIGVLCSSSTNLIVEKQDIAGGAGGTGTSIGIQMDSSMPGSVIRNNTIYSGAANSGTASSVGIHLVNNSAPVRVDGNTIFVSDRTSNLGSPWSAMGIFTNANVPHIIVNNVIKNNSSGADNYGIVLDGSVGTNAIIVNNTISLGTSGTNWAKAIQIRQSSNPVIANNIIFSTDLLAGVGINEAVINADPTRVENNLIFNMPESLYLDVDIAGAINSIAVLNTLSDVAFIGSNITTSPQTNYSLSSIFINASNGDYRLVPGSIYASSGKNVYNDPIYGSITTNRNGEARPSSGSWSVGAY